MNIDANTQQLVTTLILQAATAFDEGKSRADVVVFLIQQGATPEVAEAVATKAEAVSLGRAGKL
ncbi:hypothetical protein [Rhodoferax saidenbachensis]|uniref:Uncharacterized protein n=1 Tax=Rhodoferax saidenbachensis TaxID=1484693 RepID=A0A1P8KE26_9BURK|nr:hypothetical protein [Rhodoferax saidenbachensis]APW44273.1 hypothetical protein RS694_18235 [Rhodoferax saidenbachensis]